jgi:hypothetical protein
MKIMNCIKCSGIKLYHGIPVLFLLFLLLPSCATKYAFAISPVVPAAEGSVKVKRDKNDNYNINLSVNRLADPQRLTPSKEFYIVWMETEANGRKNIGHLKTSSGMFSNALKSSLQTISSFKPVGFFITAEDNGSAQYPVGQEVLSTKSF